MGSGRRRRSRWGEVDVWGRMKRGDEHMGRSGISFAGGIGLAYKKMVHGVKSWGFGQDWMRRRWRNDKEWRFH